MSDEIPDILLAQNSGMTREERGLRHASGMTVGGNGAKFRNDEGGERFTPRLRNDSAGEWCKISE